MNSAVLPNAYNQAMENKKKRKYIEIEHVPASDLPYRVLKKRTGVKLGSFETQKALDEFVDNYPLAQLESKPTRRRSSR